MTSGNIEHTNFSQIKDDNKAIFTIQNKSFMLAFTNNRLVFEMVNGTSMTTYIAQSNVFELGAFVNMFQNDLIDIGNTAVESTHLYHYSTRIYEDDNYSDLVELRLSRTTGDNTGAVSRYFLTVEEYTELKTQIKKLALHGFFNKSLDNK